MEQAAFIVEHLEKDLLSWSVLEYKHIRSMTKSVLFTNITKNAKKMAGLPINQESVLQVNPENACILDPNATMPLDASEKFHTYIIGGILGDSEPQQRTRQLLTEKLGLPYRNLGPAQLTTDTAVLAVKKVLAGTPVDKLEFRNGIAIEVAGETVILPNSYLVEDDKPILTPGISDLLKRQKGMSFA
ncbi:hypothetical protein CMO91_02545 [Candidatus Woesearchaeota archaeon]|jgi:ribosome biogenesis SPOUT family RNA methylase Rps3|nr:hypothetical protein [Candidatus Woesearchaeota archaeon]|tara:strand:- start:44 stop:604 length:561 start_codon:yes stop_codon:yes gene_type:complete